MKKAPLVSIIMNCHNGEKYLRQSIKSILNQNYKKWELIFWDNKSTDNSKKILFSFKDKRIKYYKSKKFTSLYKARNLAIKKAKGKYLSFLDTDDWWFKKKLNQQINLINNNNKINFIFSNVYRYNHKDKKKKLHFNNKIPDGKITQYLLNNYKVGILTVLINKKFFLKKKFNQNYNIIGDFDFFINLSIKENFYCIQKPLAYYRVHDNNYSKRTKIYTNELGNWLKINSKRLKKKGYSLNSINYHYYKLKLKQCLSWGTIAHW
jgi:glycosyltransferase involved in cell wall biosynthesis|tara:strand:- start:193 stop:984 length:792 start_codon:yes stop_codon:yes gene_type:complete